MSPQLVPDALSSQEHFTKLDGAEENLLQEREWDREAAGHGER